MPLATPLSTRTLKNIIYLLVSRGYYKFGHVHLLDITSLLLFSTLPCFNPIPRRHQYTVIHTHGCNQCLYLCFSHATVLAGASYHFKHALLVSLTRFYFILFHLLSTIIFYILCQCLILLQRTCDLNMHNFYYG